MSELKVRPLRGETKSGPPQKAVPAKDKRKPGTDLEAGHYTSEEGGVRLPPQAQERWQESQCYVEE